MEHTNPTLLAKTHCSGNPCRLPAGGASQDGAILAMAELGLDFDQANELSHAERLQLSESARFSMDEEITMLRKMIKNFTRAAGTSGEVDYPDNLAKSLDLLGLTCSRLASVLRVNMALSGSQDDDLRKQIGEGMTAFLIETQAPKEVKDA